MILGLVETFVAAYSSIPGLAPAITFSLLILFLLVRPTGIMGKFVEEKV
jgi:branched-subunit amino acid ABC-type transport system permease component